MNENERITRDVLAATRDSLAPELEVRLVEQIYEIEIKHQFSQERATVAGLIKNLVNEYIQNDSTKI